MILLTVEETKAIPIDDAILDLKTKEELREFRLKRESDVAKAQLKKVVEYITNTIFDNGFTTIVYFHPGMEYRHWPGRWVAGTMTGIDNDLICVKRCHTREDEKKYLSPEGDNIVDALNKAVALLDEVKE